MDQLVVNKMDDSLIVVGNKPCMLQISGTLTIAKFNDVMEAVSFYYTSRNRPSVPMGFVYSLNPAFRDLTVEAHTGRVYAAFFPMVRRNVYIPSDASFEASKFCADVDMVLAEPVNYSEWREAWRTEIQSRRVWMGLHRYDNVNS